MKSLLNILSLFLLLTSISAANEVKIFEFTIYKRNIQHEKANSNDRIISFMAQDNLSILDKQIPMWELGQNKTNTLETAGKCILKHALLTSG